MEELFRSGSIDQNRSSINWPLAKVLQRHGDAETGFKLGFSAYRVGYRDLANLSPSYSVDDEKIWLALVSGHPRAES